MKTFENLTNSSHRILKFPNCVTFHFFHSIYFQLYLWAILKWNLINGENYFWLQWKYDCYWIGLHHTVLISKELQVLTFLYLQSITKHEINLQNHWKVSKIYEIFVEFHIQITFVYNAIS